MRSEDTIYYAYRSENIKYTEYFFEFFKEFFKAEAPANLRGDGYDPAIQQDMDGATEVYVFDEGVSRCYQWRICECEMPADMPAVWQDIPENRIQRAEQILADNGIDPDEVSTVLQAVGYALLDVELYPEN